MRFQLNFDMKITCTMEELMIMFVFVNCPRVKNQSSRFTIDNNFFESTYRTRYLFFQRAGAAHREIADLACACYFIILILCP